MAFSDCWFKSQTPGQRRARPQADDDDLTQIVLSYAPYVASSSTLSIVVGAGAVGKFIGLKVLAAVAGVYGVLYVWERMMWSNRAKERAFKAQYVRYASSQLKQIIDLTSSNAGHQVHQELSSTFKRLTTEASSAKSSLQQEISDLDSNIRKYEAVASKAKTLRNKAGWLINQFDDFITKFIEYA